MIPRDHWLVPDEKQAILDYHSRFPLEGYRRLTSIASGMIGHFEIRERMTELDEECTVQGRSILMRASHHQRQ